MNHDKTKERNESVVRLYKAGLTIPQIASEFGLSLNYTIRIIRENDKTYVFRKRVPVKYNNTDRAMASLNPRVKNPDAMWEQAYKEGRL